MTERIAAAMRLSGIMVMALGVWILADSLELGFLASIGFLMVFGGLAMTWLWSHSVDLVAPKKHSKISSAAPTGVPHPAIAGPGLSTIPLALRLLDEKAYALQFQLDLLSWGRESSRRLRHCEGAQPPLTH
jgi:hypothetical protein